MKALSMMLVLCLVTGVAVFCSARNATSGSADIPVINAAEPATWQASIRYAKENLSKIANTLISVSKDENRPAEERRKAILLLGWIGNKESLDFLISNVSLRIPKERILGDVDAMLETPCKYALSKGDWRVVPAILTSLEKPKSETDLMHLAYPLEQILFRDVALAAVERQLLQKPNEVRKKNLQVLKKFLLH